jgi:hypothetical protein
MRNRIKTAQTRLAVGRNGFRISVSAICILSALSPAASQTLGTQGASGSPYQLRGTTGSSVTGEASAASTLYGALPAARPGGGISSSGIGDAASTDATGAGASAKDLTGSIGSPSALSQADQDYAASLARQNERVGTIDGLPLDSSSDAAELPGLAIGTLTLRPTLDQRIIREAVRFGTSKTSRTYSQTSLSGTLQSDWSRHQLNIDGTGTWQENLSGTGTESPSANLDALFASILINDITATIGAGIQLFSGKPHRSQCDFRRHHTVRNSRSTGQLGLQKEPRTVARNHVEVTRTMYGDATLPDGTSVTADDRDTLGELTNRIGYAISPALLPFLEASVGRENTTSGLIQPVPSVPPTPMAFAPGPKSIWAKSFRAKLPLAMSAALLDDTNLAIFRD